MINFPKPPGNLSIPICAWLERLRESAKQCELIDIEGYRIESTSGGIIARKKFTTSSGVSAPAPTGLKPMIITGFGSSLTPALPDLLICQSFNVATSSVGGGTIYVAKDIESRRTLTEFYFDNGDNVTNAYTYFTGTQADASYGDNFRLANDGTNTELQVMEKRYYTKAMLTGAGPQVPLNQAIIYAIDSGSPTGVKDPNGNDVTMIEVKPVRVWVRYATQ